MEAITLEAQPRETGKKATQAVRKNDHVPCILYGSDTDPVPFQVPTVQMEKLLYRRTSNVVEVSVDGQAWNCILKDYDLHPVTDHPQHVDFQVLREGHKITLTVPIRYQGIPEGQKNGGDTQFIVREVTISCLPSNIPTAIEIDISHLAIGDSIHVYDLDKEFDYKMADGQTLVTVVAPHIETTTTEAAEEEELEEGEELPEGEEGEELPEGEEGEAGTEEA
ncbi:50S ribosomal protein L25 [Salisaeta longa]|uniref:50S ribosomal protein L25 n=1 Tax=Salisaeta longa TaxID=503170 RepID=UPI0003F71C6A|nr:50S ribosomal protein L25 [Salisaeta longa]